MRPSDRIRTRTIGVVATISTAAVLLAGCVSAGVPAAGPAEAESLVQFRAAERSSASGITEAGSLVQFRAAERSSASGITEAGSLVQFRAAERSSTVTGSGARGAAGRYAR